MKPGKKNGVKIYLRRNGTINTHLFSAMSSWDKRERGRENFEIHLIKTKSKHPKNCKPIQALDFQSGRAQLGGEVTRRKWRNWGRKEEEWLGIFKEKNARILPKLLDFIQVRSSNSNFYEINFNLIWNSWLFLNWELGFLTQNVRKMHKWVGFHE